MTIGRCFASPPNTARARGRKDDEERIERPRVHSDEICRFWSSKMINYSPTTDNIACKNCLYFRQGADE